MERTRRALGIAAYIQEQPDVLRAVFRDVPCQAEALALDLVRRPPARVYLVASGSSRNALIGINPLLTEILSCEIAVTTPTEFTVHGRLGRARDAYALFVSQSGISAATVEAARLAPTFGTRPAVVTAEPDSLLARCSNDRVIMPIGDERVGPKTKGYTGTVATLQCLYHKLRAITDVSRRATYGNHFPAGDVSDVIASSLEGWAEAAVSLANTYRAARHIMFLGQGRHLASALEASLKVSEMSGLPASVFETEEGLHGRFHGLDAESLAVFIAGSQAEANLAHLAIAVLSEMGVPTLLLTTRDGWLGTDLESKGKTLLTAEAVSGAPRHTLRIPDVGGDGLEGMDLIPAIIPFQLFAYELAISRGLDPDKMRYPGLSSRLGIKLRAQSSA